METFAKSLLLPLPTSKIGANGGLAGSDIKVINKTDRSASITGINNHTLPDLDIVTAAGLVKSQNGPIIVILPQYAHHGKGKTIDSSAQLEYYKNIVEDQSCVLGGKQRIVTLDEYVNPLHVRQGLAYMDMHPPSDAEFDTLPHVVLTSDVNWDPSIIDNEIDLATDWYDTVQDLPNNPYVEPCFNSIGDYRHRHVANFDICSSPEIIARSTAIDSILSSNKHNMVRNERNYEALHTCLCWLSTDTVKKTIVATTQFARKVYSAPMRKHFNNRAKAEISKKVSDIARPYNIDQWQNPTFPSNGTEKKGQFVGVADSVGGALTYKILTNDSHKILFQSSVRSALKTSETNLHLEPHQRESSPKPINFIKSLRTQDENSYVLHMLPGFTPDDLIGRTSLTDTQDNGERFRARIARKILDPDKPHDI
ncbi:predicted protein [Phaeodactylum tricornutum CCAP 1055/1]|uniref:Uncharacterized protein n=2 Tax=Phaeodactylum tricornutum TaxID=2850 RepID=B7G765_PHATC|nr:predicted protein [Phaeodactylum tricornutum CCAP 1055/1]EEC45589.1 predicted protein [Phaeodactylum tricornutum CCAP 1055/1]|eukprot:XP_002182853.1 predicted protein [Phaeodactylum tricornutum CCAP 1055/1]